MRKQVCEEFADLTNHKAGFILFLDSQPDCFINDSFFVKLLKNVGNEIGALCPK